MERGRGVRRPSGTSAPTSGRPSPGWTAASVTLVVFSTLLSVVILGGLVAGVWLVAYAEIRAPDEWRGMVENLLSSRRADLPVLGQLSVRRTDLWKSHPPAGYRTRMVAAWPTRYPGVRLGKAETARIDAELAGWYRAVHRLVLGIRDYHPGPARPGIPGGR